MDGIRSRRKRSEDKASGFVAQGRQKQKMPLFLIINNVEQVASNDNTVQQRNDSKLIGNREVCRLVVDWVGS